jgi:DNA-directed RNA polymerase specialized sigma24 family protein
VLRDWLGFDTAEAAKLLGTREATVRVHLHRGREHLREALRMEEEESAR